VADVCSRHGAWLHVDAAYGGAALLVPDMTSVFAGIERADSLIIDPHKWLFAPLDCCGLLYREPERARQVHTQRGPYLQAIHDDGDRDPAEAVVGPNPADLAYHLTRRARGLPFWFSLLVHGVGAYRSAVRRALDLARHAASVLRDGPGELVLDPELSVVLFRRPGWDDVAWRGWAHELLSSGIAFVAPTRWKGETVGRLVFLHPRTDEAIVDEVLATLG